MSEETVEFPAGLRTVAGLDLKPALEAVLMVVDEPATEEHLAKILERPRRQIADALRELADEYTLQGRGFELRFVAGPASPRPRWRPSRSSPTASRSAAAASPPCAESTVTV